MEYPSIHDSKNVVIKSSLVAGGNIQIGNNYYNVAQDDFKYSILFLRIEPDGADYLADLTLKTRHETLAKDAAGMLKEKIKLSISPQLFDAVKQFQEMRRGSGEQMRFHQQGGNAAVLEDHLSQAIHQQFFGGDIGAVVGNFVEALQGRKIEELLLVIVSPDAGIRNFPFEMGLDRLCPGGVLQLQGFGLVRTAIGEFAKFDAHADHANAGPLKLLFVTALPENLAEKGKQLELEDEQRKLIEAVGHLEATGDSHPKMVIEFLDVASLDEIAKALRERDHDVLHISGHGGWDAQQKQGILYLENDQGDLQETKAAALAQVLKGLKHLKLLVLSACETAVAGDEGTADVLALSGIPAVLAMRFAVSDEGAQDFTTEFYKQLVHGKSITEAVAGGRMQLHARVAQQRQDLPEYSHNAEWFTPVLYLNQYVEGLVDERAYHFPEKFYLHSHILKESHTRFIGGGFIGRKRQRIQMRQALQGHRHICLVGMGGMGKTTLAEAFAHNYDSHSHKVIIWRGDKEISEMGVLNRIIQKYKSWHPKADIEELKSKIEDGQLPITKRLDYLLDNCLAHEKAILIFDNFEDLQWQEGDADSRTIVDEGIRNLLIHLLQRCPRNCHIVFTTRYEITGLPGDVDFLNLDRLSQAEQYRLMNFSESLRKIGKSERERVYRRLDGLPRAYEYLEGLAKHDTHFSWENLENDLSQVKGEVFMNLMLGRIYKLLRPDLQALFLSASVFFTRSPLAALSAASGQAMEQLRPQLSQLMAWSLCYWDADKAEFEVHGLTRDWVESEGLLAKEDRKRVAFAAGEYFRDQPTWDAEALAIQYFEQAEAWEPFAEASFRLQGFYQRIGLYPKAWELCAAVLEKVNDKRSQGLALGNMGKLLHHLGKYAEALRFLEQSLKICHEIGDRAGEGATLNNIGQIYNARGNYDTALRYLEQSLKIRQEFGDRAGEGATLNNISQVCSARGNYDTALRYLEHSLKIQQEIGDKKGESVTLGNMGTLAHAKGDYQKALTYFEMDIKICKEIGDRPGEGVTLNNISQIYKARGDYDMALRYLEQSLKITQEVGDRAGEGATLNNLATTAHARGDYDTALRYLEQSLKIQQEIGDRAGEGTTLNNIGQIYKTRGDYATALHYLEQSLKITQEIGNRAGEGATLNNISLIYNARGDSDTALHYLELSLKIKQEIGDRAGEGATLNNISQIYDARGDYETALRYLEQSLKIRKEIGDIAGMATTLHNMGTISFGREAYEAAMPYFLKAYATLKQIGSPNVQHPEKYLGAIIGKIGEERFQEIASQINLQEL